MHLFPWLFIPPYLLSGPNETWELPDTKRQQPCSNTALAALDHYTLECFMREKYIPILFKPWYFDVSLFTAAKPEAQLTHIYGRAECFSA